jgi:hypothetical protein
MPICSSWFSKNQKRRIRVVLFSYLATVKPLDRSVFTEFANPGIFGKWLDIVCWGTPNLFAILP